jgi:hypothetical protein
MEYFAEEYIDYKIEEFERHLKNADRMILSAKFGDGKSFFLQKIRNDEKLKSEYEFITLYPVNYVVSQNEDIFEYIKRDILVQLVKLGMLNKIDLTKLITSVGSYENLKEVLFFLVSCIPTYGPIIKKMLEKGMDIAKKYNDEKATYQKYFGAFKAQKGGLYEDDAYTQMIKEALNQYKVGYLNDKGEVIEKKTVLIIEDLDRLDPAHLFRILNVISAHIDDTTQPDKVGNKFGFSNIVLVMDYDSTQHIFEHFYGKNASYNGYMSKFIAEEPFRYSITGTALMKLKDKIVREVGIRMEFLDAFTILNKIFNNLSIRDIVRLYDLDLSTRFYNEIIAAPNKMKLSFQLPIFKLLIYMTELGMTYADIDEDLRLNPNYKELEYLQLIYPLALINTTLPPKIFDSGSSRVKVDYKVEDDIIKDIYIEEYYGEAIKIDSVKTLDKNYAWICDILSRYIDIAGFNRSRSHSVFLNPTIKINSPSYTL